MEPVSGGDYKRTVLAVLAQSTATPATTAGHHAHLYYYNPLVLLPLCPGVESFSFLETDECSKIVNVRRTSMRCSARP